MNSVKLSLEQQIALCQQIARLTHSKLPLEAHLQDIAKSESGALAQSAATVEQQLVQGKRLVDALAAEDTRDSRILAACIEAGQSCNRLDKTLEEWTSMHIANAQSAKRLRSVMVYPVLLILILLISIGLTSWHLIPEIRDTYELFDRNLPAWLEWLVWTRSHFAWMISLMILMTVSPLLIWLRRRFIRDSHGVPKQRVKRMRLQALATRLAHVQLMSSRPLSEILPRCMQAMGLPKSESELAFKRLQEQGPLVPLPAETSMLLGAIYGGVINREKAMELLDQIGKQLSFRADVESLRESRWLPMLVAIVVCVVVLISYLLLIYLPWVELLRQIVKE